MLTKVERDSITRLVRHWVVPAVGCTEPICVALAAAKAASVLGGRPEKVTARLSANILKNAMGVGIPATGMVGLPIAIALGVLVGDPADELEVLKKVTPQDVEAGKAYIDEGRILIQLAEDAPEKLYVDVTVNNAEGEARVVIAREHTNFVLVKKGAETLLERSLGHSDADAKSDSVNCDDYSDLTFERVYEYATTTPLEEIDFIKDAARLNEEASNLSLRGNYGHRLGKALTRPLGRGIMGESIFSHILSSTSLACDARMAGAMIPVMSNSGSGNQGICATNPVTVFARENHNTDEELTRALMLSHLTAIYIKLHLGTLSALCGCVVASTGSSCGITYLMGGNYRQVTYAIQNMIANLTGMICDGAKPSCALKLTSGVSTAVLSAMLAMQDEHVTSVEGIIDDDVDKSIRNLVSIGADAMVETDRCVLDIMTHKTKP